MLALQVMAADPTEPEYAEPSTAAATRVVTAQPKLTLIQSSGQRFQAVVNGQLVRPGDQLDGYLVQQINARQVVLVQGERRLVLNLFKTTK
jgi:MSHA biogenesis protein MshK